MSGDKNTGGTFYEAAAVRDAARGVWETVLSQLGASQKSLQGGHSPCPGCGGRDRFRFDDQDGNGTFICSQGSGDLLSGDGLSLVQHITGCSWPEAIERVGDILIPEQGRPWGRPSAGGTRRKKARQSAPELSPDAEKAMTFDLDKLKAVQRRDWEIDEDWLFEHSPGDVAAVDTPMDFLDAIFEPGEKVLLFTEFFSQGQYIHWVGRGTFVLASRPGVRAAPSEGREPLPLQNREGMWFLSQPIDGKWYPNPRAKTVEGRVKLSRRSQESVTDWRHTVLENDDAPQDLWLNFLAQLPLPICAIYTSAARSVHALVRLPAADKEAWDRMRKTILPLFSKFGADPGSLTGVRLTRLPGVQRLVNDCKCGRKKTAAANGQKCKCGAWLKREDAVWRDQKLLYLNPRPDPAGVPIGQGGNQIFGDDSDS